MRLNKFVISIMTIIWGIILVLPSSTVDACMCMPEHPQEHYCNSDYVIIARILRKSVRLVPNKIAYKIAIKKQYKINDNSTVYLKHERITTARDDSLCGVDLKIGHLYVIAGKSLHVNQCNYIKEYLKMSLVERRGFAGSYRKGCKCHIKPCWQETCPASLNQTCNWSPRGVCQTTFGACVPGRNYMTKEGPVTKCNWRRSPLYKSCINDQ